MYQFYLKRIPAANADPLVANQEPLNNYRTAGDPDPITNQIFGTRLDYNLSDKHRFFFRFSKSRFTEGLGDWTWETELGLMASDTLRRPLSGTFDWTYTKSAQTVISAQISANRYYEGSRTVVAAQYKPSDVGLPKYMDTKCAITACTMPTISFQVRSYTTLGQNAPSAFATYNRQGTLNITQVLEPAHAPVRRGCSIAVPHLDGSRRLRRLVRISPTSTRARTTTPPSRPPATSA